MDLAGLVLIAAGAGALIVGLLRIRGPRATIRRLEETEANLQRYEAWRGKNNAIESDGPTGADEMKAQMRQRVLLWAVVSGVGAVMIVAGLII